MKDRKKNAHARAHEKYKRVFGGNRSIGSKTFEKLQGMEGSDARACARLRKTRKVEIK